MTFIGIAIFTIYYKTQICIIDMTNTKLPCRVETREDGISKLIYVGEFNSYETCADAVKTATYKVKNNERLDSIRESLCVEKILTSASPP